MSKKRARRERQAALLRKNAEEALDHLEAFYERTKDEGLDTSIPDEWFSANMPVGTQVTNIPEFIEWSKTNREAAIPIMAEFELSMDKRMGEVQQELDDKQREIRQIQDKIHYLEKPPIWEQSVGFGPVFKFLSVLAEAAKQTDSDDIIQGAIVDNEARVQRVTLNQMRTAHPIIVSPEWVEAQPPLSDNINDALNYGGSVRLPFDTVYFDFMGVGGKTVRPKLDGWLAAFDEYISPEWGSIQDGLQHIELVGASAEVIDSEHGPGITVIPVIRLNNTDMELGGQLQSPVAATGVGMFWEGDTDWEETHLFASENGWTIVPLPALTGNENNVGAAVAVAERVEDRDALMQAAITLFAADLVLRVCFMMDSANVELADAPVSRQVRRHAERKGRDLRISKIVRVQTSRTSHATSRGDGHSVDYSHRFERAGSLAHYGPETQLYAQSAPAYIKPCPRCGTCRRVWRPPTVVGPEDKPFIPKARMIPQDA